MNDLSQLLPHINFPSEIYFKKGSLIRLKFLNINKGVVITGENSLKQSGALEKIKNYLKSCELKIFSINSEPTLQNIQKLAGQLSSFNPEAIIACGGGSVLDTAKMVKLLLAYPKLNMLDNIKPHSLPVRNSEVSLVAIPTTTGSGAEASLTALVIDSKKKRKIPFVSSSLIPNMIILDPELILSLSPYLICSTTLDAFTHALESFSSTLCNNFSDQYAIMAGSLIHKYLLITLEKPGCLEQYEHLQFAALFAGIAQNNTSVGAIHALSHALGATLKIPHALGNVIFLPAVLQINHKYSSRPSLFLKQIGFKSVENFLVWFSQVKACSGLKSNWSKITTQSKTPPTEHIASQALKDICMKTNTYQFTLKELNKILLDTK